VLAEESVIRTVGLALAGLWWVPDGASLVRLHRLACVGRCAAGASNTTLTSTLHHSGHLRLCVAGLNQTLGRPHCIPNNTAL
jgi:hypothetical protein